MTVLPDTVNTVPAVESAARCGGSASQCHGRQAQWALAIDLWPAPCVACSRRTSWKRQGFGARNPDSDRETIGRLDFLPVAPRILIS